MPNQKRLVQNWQWQIVEQPMDLELLKRMLSSGFIPTTVIMTKREKTASEKLNPVTGQGGSFVIEPVVPFYRVNTKAQEGPVPPEETAFEGGPVGSD